MESEATMEVESIDFQNYILLPDGTVARRLKPTIKNNKTYYFLHLGGKLVRKEVKDIESTIPKVSHHE